MFRDLRLRASPWIALVGGLGYLTWVFLDKKSSVTFNDLYPGLLVLVASVVLFAMLRFLKLTGDEDVEITNEDEATK